MRASRLSPLWLALSATLLLAGCGGGSAPSDQAAAGKDTAAQTADAKTETKPDGAPGKDGAKKEEETRIPVEIAVASRRTINASFQGTATLEADAEAQVVTKTSGVVLEILVEEGDQVAKGQVLARLDNDRQRLALAQTRAVLRKLENDYQRQQELHARKLIGAEVFERSKFDLENQRASSAMMELELSYTEIRAPIAGVVSKRFVKVGNLLTLNQPVFKIDDFDPLLAVLSVPEREMTRIAPGQAVQMLVDAVPGKVFTGQVQRVAPTVEAGSGTFRVTAEFREPDTALRSGMFGRLNLVYESRDNVLTVPRAALLGEDAASAAVFAVADGKVLRKPVQLGYIGDGIAEIKSGLDDGAQVVTLGQAALREGTLVQVLNPPAEATQIAQPGAAQPSDTAAVASTAAAGN